MATRDVGCSDAPIIEDSDVIRFNRSRTGPNLIRDWLMFLTDHKGNERLTGRQPGGGAPNSPPRRRSPVVLDSRDDIRSGDDP